MNNINLTNQITTEGFIRNSIKSIKLENKKISQYETTKYFRNIYSYKYNNITRESIYTLNDTIYYTMNSLYSNNELIQSLTHVCTTYQFIAPGLNPVSLIEEELNFKNMLLLNNYDFTNNEYTDQKVILDNFYFFDRIYNYSFHPKTYKNDS